MPHFAQKCPRCKAAIGEPCTVVRDGKRKEMADVHVERLPFEFEAKTPPHVSTRAERRAAKFRPDTTPQARFHSILESLPQGTQTTL